MIPDEHHRKHTHQDQTGENLVISNGIGTIIYFKRFYKDYKRVLRNAGLLCGAMIKRGDREGSLALQVAAEMRGLVPFMLS